jgi:hypothetical protein
VGYCLESFNHNQRSSIEGLYDSWVQSQLEIFNRRRFNHAFLWLGLWVFVGKSAAMVGINMEEEEEESWVHAMEEEEEGIEGCFFIFVIAVLWVLCYCEEMKCFVSAFWVFCFGFYFILKF